MNDDSSPFPKSTTPRFFCFVLMPFEPAFSDVYQIGIKEACEAAGAYCERVDEQIFSERILDRIYNQIAKADLVIADMTGRNPNVFYEVGYAHALGKPTVLLTRSADDIPFDLKHFPHIVYESKLTTLRNELQKRVAWNIANPSAELAETRFPLECYFESQRLSDTPTLVLVRPSSLMYFYLVFRNISERPISADSFRIGVEGSANLSPQGDHCVDLPDGRRCFYLDHPEREIFPQQYVRVFFPLGLEKSTHGTTEAATLMIFTGRGTAKFQLSIRADKAARLLREG